MKSPAMLDLDPVTVPPFLDELEVEVVFAFTVVVPKVSFDEVAKRTLGVDFGSSSPGGA